MANEGNLVIEEAKTIPQGLHNAVISNVTIESRNSEPDVKGEKETYQYVDLHVKLDEVPDIILRAGFPAKVTEKTGLGMLLQRFGHKIEVGKQINVITALKGKKIKCITADETNSRGTFARIQQSSIVPA